MAEDTKKTPFIITLLKPQNLKRIILGLLILALLIGGIYLISQLTKTRAPDQPYWHRTSQRIKFHSYSNQNIAFSYGTFFCQAQIYIAYTNEDVGDELKNESAKINDTIRQVISAQNYYTINNETKRIYNLIPKLVKAINLVLRTPGGVTDISFPVFMVMLESGQGNPNYSFYEMGKMTIDVARQAYEIETYVVYDRTSRPFNRKLNIKKNDMILEVKRYIEKKLSDEGNEDLQKLVNERSIREYVKSLVKRKVESYFKTDIDEQIKKEHPDHEIKNRLKTVFFGLFRPIK
ncbi:MAG: hypothetical protein OEZ36_04890 [Spirochaetota bacterium]|nr:hypothetical protein [Spirochaetota bacterium]